MTLHFTTSISAVAASGLHHHYTNHSQLKDHSHNLISGSKKEPLLVVIPLDPPHFWHNKDTVLEGVDTFPVMLMVFLTVSIWKSTLEWYVGWSRHVALENNISGSRHKPPSCSRDSGIPSWGNSRAIEGRHSSYIRPSIVCPLIALSRGPPHCLKNAGSRYILQSTINQTTHSLRATRYSRPVASTTSPSSVLAVHPDGMTVQFFMASYFKSVSKTLKLQPVIKKYMDNPQKNSIDAPDQISDTLDASRALTGSQDAPAIDDPRFTQSKGRSNTS